MPGREPFHPGCPVSHTRVQGMKGPPWRGKQRPVRLQPVPPPAPPQNSVGGSHQSSCLPLPPEPHPREPPTERSACPASSRRALPRAGSVGPTAGGVGAEGEVRSSSRRCSRRGSEGRPLPGRHRGRGGPVSVRPPPAVCGCAVGWPHVGSSPSPVNNSGAGARSRLVLPAGCSRP